MTEINPPTDHPHERGCDVCGGLMTHLGDLPSMRTQASIQVFRCYGCDHVVSKPRGQAADGLGGAE